VINSSYKVSIIIEKNEDGYYAYCPELQGCFSQGDSFEEVNENIREAIELYLESNSFSYWRCSKIAKAILLLFSMFRRKAENSSGLQNLTELMFCSR
jgi:predicted RNase H-like HicB family nuclease